MTKEAMLEEITALLVDLGNARARLARVTAKATARRQELRELSTEEIVAIAGERAGFLPLTTDRYTRAEIIESEVSRDYPVERIARTVAEINEELQALINRAGA